MNHVMQALPAIAINKQSFPCGTDGRVAQLLIWLDTSILVDGGRPLTSNRTKELYPLTSSGPVVVGENRRFSCVEDKYLRGQHDPLLYIQPRALRDSLPPSRFRLLLMPRDEVHF